MWGLLVVLRISMTQMSNFRGTSFLKWTLFQHGRLSVRIPIFAMHHHRRLCAFYDRASYSGQPVAKQFSFHQLRAVLNLRFLVIHHAFWYSPPTRGVSPQQQPQKNAIATNNLV